MYPISIQNLIEQFARFPGVGQRTATRYVFHLIRLPQKDIEVFTQDILDLKKKIKLCKLCFNSFEGENEFCPICRDSNRNHHIICIVEKETDILPIERTKRYSGLYFVLGGSIFSQGKMDLNTLRMGQLKTKIQKSKIPIQEIILAFNPTIEGDATALYLTKQIREWIQASHSHVIKITRLGRGLPMGGELEYVDEETLTHAFEGRK